MSLILIAALTASVSQCALAITAGDALFGEVMSHVSAPEASGDTETNGGTGVQSQYVELKLGDADSPDGYAYIVFLQKRLIQLGYLLTGVDGVYGSTTEEAVRAFQRNNGLPETGIADVATQERVFANINSIATPAPSDIKYGNDEVKLVQDKLLVWGFLNGWADGLRGTDTNSAIVEFKKYMIEYEPGYGTAPTPTPAPVVAEGDMPIVIDVPLVTPEPGKPVADKQIDHYVMEYVLGVKDFTLYRKDVALGDKGADALRVQKRLKQLNYLYSADGEFGANSERALKYFQRKHALEETGVADRITQNMLFSTQAIKAEEYVFPYRIGVDLSEQTVYIMGWDGEGYNELVGSTLCSTGINESPTPTGTFQAQGRTGGENQGEWYYFREFNCYAKWAYRIVGGIMFHSVVYDEDKRLRQSSVTNLGRKASHGCIRMPVANAKWIYDNCPMGTTVEIHD